MVKLMNETVSLSVLSDSIEALKSHPNFHDLKIKYRSNGSIIERQFNTTLLALHSEYFLESFKSSPIYELDLTKIVFEGKVLEIVFDSVFGGIGKDDFNLWLKDGILCQVYEAAYYFLHQPLMNALDDYMKNDVLSVLKSEYDSPAVIIEKLRQNNLFTILDDDCFQDSPASKSMYKFLQKNLIPQLEKEGSEINVPAKVIGKVLKLNPNVHDKDESSVFDLFITVYEGLCTSDQAILKPFMLNYFDYRNLSNEQIGRFVKGAEDMKVFFTAPSTERLALPLAYSEALFTFNSNDDSFAVEIPIKYGIYEMKAQLKVSRNDMTCLACFLYYDATKITDRIPEIVVSIIEISRRRSIKRVINSISIDRNAIDGNDKYVSSAMGAVGGQDKAFSWGWHQFLKRSKLIHGKQYQLSVILNGFSFFWARLI